MAAEAHRTHTLTVRTDTETKSIAAQNGESFLSVLRGAGYRDPAAPCGGNGRCGACLLRVSGPVISVSGGTRHEAQDELIPACRWAPAGDCRVSIPSRGAVRALTAGAGDIPPCGEGLGLAVDLGTTTVACFLYELSTGQLLGTRGERSAQRAFGADVLSRILCCSESPEGLGKLASAAREQVRCLAQTLSREAGRRTEEIQRVAVAGNTTMQHIFAGLSPVGLGAAPFTPRSLFGAELEASRLLPGLAPGAALYLAPALAGYVGGDVTAGLYAAGAAEYDGLCLYLDIGTNGEMGLGSREGFLCCAAAAGPAFEGAEIACGMDAADGAIDRVCLRDGLPTIHVLGGGKARGLCGSGLIDTAAALLDCGALTPAGRLLPPEEAPEALQRFLRRGEDGIMRFYLTEEVYVSAADLRELQLAKAALRAGAETLLALRGKSAEDLDCLLIAGGFGAYMDLRSALRIGLLPPVPMERIRHVGNAAGAGAALALSMSERVAMESFSTRCSYHELSGSALFTELYVEHMAFEEDEED